MPNRPIDTVTCYSLLVTLLLVCTFLSCTGPPPKAKPLTFKTAEEILSNPDYLAICYGGYREKTRNIQPSIPELKEDLSILSALGIKFMRTYNVHLAEAENLLEAIQQMKSENPQFEMYVMLGAWISCKNAFTAHPIHEEESELNKAEIEKAAALAKKYPDIVKIIAVGNEAMVKWATDYYVQPEVILQWVRYLQNLKKQGDLPPSLWITSSDNFASWGGGGSEYKNETLYQLCMAVDYLSIHTYPMHDTHYNPYFWGVSGDEVNSTDMEKINACMMRARDHAVAQYDSVKHYLSQKAISKRIHIGETGWSSQSNSLYGDKGSKATDEYKAGLYYNLMREWSRTRGVSCFYFEAFDEQWKDAANPLGSENHFGLINLQGQAKYTLWKAVDKGLLNGLTRNGLPITKTFNGHYEDLLKTVSVPPLRPNIKSSSAIN